MAPRSALSAETLAALGVDRLARLVMEGVDRDPGFKRIVAAALASTKGPKAITALIDKRLAGLERARGYVEWDKAKAFAADLDATRVTIVEELGSADPVLASSRLLRFIATSASVLDRTDDSNGRVQAVYQEAVGGLGVLTPRLPVDERSNLPDRIMTVTGSGEFDLLPPTVEAVAPHLDAVVLTAWDKRLAREIDGLAPTGKTQGWSVLSRRHDLLNARQILALVSRDLDGLAALESGKHPNLQNTLGLAQIFLDAGRPAEALEWVRRKPPITIRYLGAGDLTNDRWSRHLSQPGRVTLEAQILDALNRPKEAQALRWSAFEATLEAGFLREHIGHLGEFEEFETLDRAFAHAEQASDIEGALSFFVAWPHVGKAAALVIRHRTSWDGRSYEVLGPAANALEAAEPAAATILYRRLLETILDHAQSSAYGHAARYLAKLGDIAPAVDPAALGLSSHATFRAEIMKKHARKSSFWAHVDKK